jgi:hypothetical protein
MKQILLAACASFLILSACSKKTEQAPTVSTEPAPAATNALVNAVEAGSAGAPVAKAQSVTEPTEAERERAEKQARLDYSTMEDQFINDPHAQWAVAAKASLSFGSANTAAPDSHDSNTPWQATGAPNNSSWSNNNQDIGFDWIEAQFAKPVSATEVRAVLTSSSIGSVSKVELVDADGKYHTVWSGVDETKQDDRGRRTWFVRKFPATAYKAVGGKITFANAVNNGYKEVDAVQIVGE